MLSSRFSFLKVLPFLFNRLIRRAVGQGGRTIVPGHEGGTQTQIHPSGGETRVIERVTQSQGEVRVIVQPIQPVFYMPRQSKAHQAFDHFIY